MKICGNKGEWSELYAFIYLLGTGKLYAADDNLKKVNDLFFPVLKIIRNERESSINEYIIVSENVVQMCVDGVKSTDIDRNKLVRYATYLYRSIIEGSNRSFEIAQANEIMNELGCSRISAPSKDKTDITMQIYDIQTGYSPICGFSIKSEIGNSPTLLNASISTNFIYKVTGLKKEQMDEVNSIDTKNKIIDRIAYINRCGKLEFDKVHNYIFSSNLMLVDSKMEEILAEALVFQYSSGITDCEKVIDELEKRNPLKFPGDGFYRFKFKKLLCSIALGMVPSKLWNGQDEANGGYVIVTKDGEVLAYHIYNRDFFETYLLKNTKFEKASTSRHNYAKIYEKGENMYINLNLQIRFK